MKTILSALVAFSLLAVTGVASAAHVDTEEAHYQYCHFVAEANRSQAITDSRSEEDVQLAYEDAFDYCDSLDAAGFTVAAGVSLPMPKRAALRLADRLNACGIDRVRGGWVVVVDCETDVQQ